MYQQVLFSAQIEPPKDKFWKDLVSGEIAKKIQEAAPSKYLGASADVYNVMKPFLADKPDVERMCGIYLNRKNAILTIDVLSTGSIAGASVYPREIIKAMIQKQAASLVLCHNHPSGDPSPSPEDVNITRQMVYALWLIGATLLDHVIIGTMGRVYSFGDTGKLSQYQDKAREIFI